MSDHQLLNQLKGIKELETAPVLWRAQLRQNLLKAVAADQPVNYSGWEKVWLIFKNFRAVTVQLHLAPVTLTIALLVATGIPVAQATAGSLPGQTLYPVKRLAEKVELSFKTSPTDRGLYYLQLANNRLQEVAAVSSPATQASLFKDYNINVGFAQASLQTAGQDHQAVASYDNLSQALAGQLLTLQNKTGNDAGYKAAVSLTEKLSSNTLAMLVSVSNNEQDDAPVAERLQSQIARVEAKLNGVDGKLVSLPQNKPLKVVIESKQSIVPVKEATRQAKDSLNQAKDLVEKKFYTLALQKVQEGEEITSQTEAVIDKTEAAGAQVTPATGDVKTDAKGKVEGATSDKTGESVKVDSAKTNQPTTVEPAVMEK